MCVCGTHAVLALTTCDVVQINIKFCVYKLDLICQSTVISIYYSSLDLYKEFQEEAYSIAVHPSGLHILVGFSEKLRLMNILIDDIRPFKEFVIRGCKEV